MGQSGPASRVGEGANDLACKEQQNSYSKRFILECSRRIEGVGGEGVNITKLIVTQDVNDS